MAKLLNNNSSRRQVIYWITEFAAFDTERRESNKMKLYDLHEVDLLKKLTAMTNFPKVFLTKDKDIFNNFVTFLEVFSNSINETDKIAKEGPVIESSESLASCQYLLSLAGGIISSRGFDKLLTNDRRKALVKSLRESRLVLSNKIDAATDYLNIR